MIIRRVFGGAVRTFYKGLTQEMPNIWLCEECQYLGEDETTCKDCHCELMCSFVKPPEVESVVYEWTIYGQQTQVLAKLRALGAWPRTIVSVGAYLKLFGISREPEVIMDLIMNHDATVVKDRLRPTIGCKVGAKTLYDDGKRYWG